MEFQVIDEFEIGEAMRDSSGKRVTIRRSDQSKRPSMLKTQSPNKNENEESKDIVHQLAQLAPNKLSIGNLDMLKFGNKLKSSFNATTNKRSIMR
jgi:hypothetical protein